MQFAPPYYMYTSISSSTFVLKKMNRLATSTAATAAPADKPQPEPRQSQRLKNILGLDRVRGASAGPSPLDRKDPELLHMSSAMVAPIKAYSMANGYKYGEVR